MFVGKEDRGWASFLVEKAQKEMAWLPKEEPLAAPWELERAVPQQAQPVAPPSLFCVALYPCFQEAFPSWGLLQLLAWGLWNSQHFRLLFPHYQEPRWNFQELSLLPLPLFD